MLKFFDASVIVTGPTSHSYSYRNKG